MIGDDRLGFSRGYSTDPWHAIPTSLAHVYERVKLSPIIVTFSDRLLYTTDNESYVPTNELRFTPVVLSYNVHRSVRVLLHPYLIKPANNYREPFQQLRSIYIYVYIFMRKLRPVTEYIFLRPINLTKIGRIGRSRFSRIDRRCDQRRVSNSSGNDLPTVWSMTQRRSESATFIS